MAEQMMLDLVAELRAELVSAKAAAREALEVAESAQTEVAVLRETTRKALETAAAAQAEVNVLKDTAAKALQMAEAARAEVVAFRAAMGQDGAKPEEPPPVVKEEVVKAATLDEPTRAKKENAETCQCSSTQCFQYGCVNRSQQAFRQKTGGGSQEQLTRNLPQARGTRFCERCLCGFPGCKNRTRQRSRWCHAAGCPGRDWVKRAGAADYANTHDTFVLDPDWGSPLKAP
jgi:hypothetical protein